MSVYKPKTSPYYQYDFQWKGRRFSGSTGVTTKRDAERFEVNERRKVALGTDAKPTATLNEAAQRWWEAVGKHRKSHVTTDYQLTALVKGIGPNKMLHEITITDFDRYVARRRAKLSNASVNREVELARAVWRWNGKRGFEVAEPHWRDLLLKEKQERIRELSKDEEARLFEALHDNLKPIVEFALLSGQRRSEVIKLRWSDVDLTAARATFNIKGGEKRVLPLTPRMVALIANQPKVCAQVFTYVCLRPAPPRADRPRRLKGERYPFSEGGWARQWKQALEDAGIADFRFHDLRHTKGTRALRATGNLKAVSKMLGHTSVLTTSRYAHALEDDVRAAMLDSESQNSPEAGNVTVLKTAEIRRKEGK